MNDLNKEVILKTVGLTKHYGGVRALEDANFSISSHEHIAIVGDNGAGKSTFVRSITGVERPTFGKSFLMVKKLILDPLLMQEKVVLKQFIKILHLLMILMLLQIFSW